MFRNFTAVLVCLLAAAHASAGTFSAPQQLYYSAAEVQQGSLSADTYLTGYYDPVFSLWWNGGVMQWSAGFDPSLAGKRSDDPAVAASLAAGHVYVVAVSASGAFPQGGAMADGVFDDGGQPLATIDWCNSAGACGRGAGFDIIYRLASVAAFPAPLSQVPEPSAAALLLAGLATLALALRRHRRPAA